MSNLNFINRVLLTLLGVAMAVRAQTTQIDLRTQSKDVDFSSAVSTKPVKVGVSLPATCTAGEVFFELNPPTTAALFGCSSANTWVALSGSSNMNVTTGSGAPSGACTPGQTWFLDVSATPANLWYCNISGAWRQMVDTSGLGPFVMTGQTSSPPGTPPAGSGSAWFDTATGLWRALVGTTTSSTVIPATCSGAQFVNGIAASGTPTCGTPSGGGGGGSAPQLTQWFHAATCVNSGAVASGAWQMRSDEPLNVGCNSLIDGSPQQATLQFVDTADQFLWLQTMIPAGWTTGEVSLTLASYPAASTGDTRFGVSTKCIAAGGSTTGSYNTETFQIRSQGTAFTPFMTTFNSLNMTGCSAGNLLVIQLRRQPACTGCANGNMAAIEYFLGGLLTIN